jgi:hypothetical protein
MNTATDSSMPASQVRASPQRGTARSHSGMDSAALRKYAPRKAPCTLAGNCSRSSMKNSTSVAGMALAMPLGTNTAIRRRNAAWRQGCQRADQGMAAPALGVSAGRGARAQASHPAASSTANTATSAPTPASDDSTEASTTPTSAAASRQATMRLRCASLPPSSAPQAWCAMLTRL